jgi:predicted adenylyl cyclase CyaB
VARNVEIKARVENLGSLESRVRELANRGPIELDQDDTFFRCDAGRLKLRTLSKDAGELVFYQRNDEAGPKESFYIRPETNHPNSLRESLALAYGVTGRVRKHRKLYMIGRTRVHLDTVESLGTFLELEVVLDADEAAEHGSMEARHLLERLGIRESALVNVAYVDLLASP